METIGHINIPDHVIAALERGILKAVQDRIDNDPDVADTYLRVIAEDNKFSIQVMYIEESNLTDPNYDIALLDLMIDRNNLDGAEYWEPDTKAIRKYAESFKEMITINVCQN